MLLSIDNIHNKNNNQEEMQNKNNKQIMSYMRYAIDSKLQKKIKLYTHDSVEQNNLAFPRFHIDPHF